MGNLTGENFYKYVDNQIKVRQQNLGSVTKTTEQILHQNASTPWIKLVSSINIDNEIKSDHTIGDEGKIRLAKLGLNTSLYPNNELAKAFILFSGTSYTKDSYTFLENDSVLSKTANSGDNSIGLRSSFNISPIGSTVLNDNSYGFGSLEFGFRPMPGITSIDVKSKNRGSLKEATVLIKAFTAQQFNIIDALYMRLGYTVLLEWGNSSYFNNNNEYISNPINISIANDFLNYSNPITIPKDAKAEDFGQGKILQLVENKRKESCGNYDAVYGKIVNFNWEFTTNGVYEITIHLVSIGDVIESLTVNKTDPIVSTDSNEEGEKEEISIETERNKHNIGRYLYKLYKLKDLSNPPQTINTENRLDINNNLSDAEKKVIADKKAEEDQRLTNIGLSGPKI